MVFLDESGVNINMTRHYGRSLSSERAVDHTPLNTPQTTTILSSIRLSGEKAYTTYQGGTTGAQFVSYLEKTLIPTLHKGDIVVMDNLRSHHIKKVTELLWQNHIECLYLPPYSPDLNPIEKMWSKMKSILRKWKVREQENLESAIHDALERVSQTDILHWFAASGYCL
jgi:transposase